MTVQSGKLLYAGEGLPVCCMVSTDPIVITAGTRQFRVFYAGIFLWSLMCCIIRRVVADCWASFAWVLPTAFISVNPWSLSRITPTFSNFSESRSVILLISGRRKPPNLIAYSPFRIAFYILAKKQYLIQSHMTYDAGKCFGFHLARAISAYMTPSQSLQIYQRECH